MSDQSINATSAALDAVPKTYERAVRVLAVADASVSDQVEIYYLPDPQQRCVLDRAGLTPIPNREGPSL